jgi:hypothetical protein
MMLAFLSWLSNGSEQWVVPAGGSQVFAIGLPPVRFVAPITTSGDEEADTDDEDDPTFDPIEFEEDYELEE